MKKKVVITRSPEETREFAREFAFPLLVGDVIALVGELGSGKTTFVQGLANGLNIKENVSSPTYKIINEFSGRLPLYHIDFYRIKEPVDILNIGFEHYIYGEGVTVIEWADRFPELIPDNVMNVTFLMKKNNPDLRKIEISQGKLK